MGVIKSRLDEELPYSERVRGLIRQRAGWGAGGWQGRTAVQAASHWGVALGEGLRWRGGCDRCLCRAAVPAALQGLWGEGGQPMLPKPTGHTCASKSTLPHCSLQTPTSPSASATAGLASTSLKTQEPRPHLPTISTNLTIPAHCYPFSWSNAGGAPHLNLSIP